MKTAISIPDELYYVVERYVEKRGLSRSELYVDAIRNFMERIEKREMQNITEKINAVCDNLGADMDINQQIKSVNKRMLLDSE